MKEPSGPDSKGGFDTGMSDAKEGAGGGSFKTGGGSDHRERESDVNDVVAFVKGKGGKKFAGG